MDHRKLTERQVRSLTHLGFHVDRVRDMDQQTFIHVRAARDEGCSWAMIGTVLGVSTQAAWQRYRTEQLEAQEPHMAGEVQLPFEPADETPTRDVGVGPDVDDIERLPTEAFGPGDYPGKLP